MKFKNIHIIINPESGHYEPIVAYLNDAFHGSNIEWDISIIKGYNDAKYFAQKWSGKVDVIAVYGGDGSISEVAKVLMGSDTPLAILPGGTANVISKELGIPQNTIEAIELLKSFNTECIRMDMASANDCLFMIRVNLGIMADMVLDASTELKNKVGQLAYGIAGIQSVVKTEPVKYNMKIDGLKILEEGVALTVTNCGNIGIGDYSFLPDISISDGFLDVILLNHADLISLLKIAGTTFMKTESEVLKHWKCKEMEISFDTAQKFILDDCAMEAKYLHIKVIPSALKVIVPLTILR
jgi:YegS/Rv2252/BmrU family lipid kinase